MLQLRACQHLLHEPGESASVRRHPQRKLNHLVQVLAGTAQRIGHLQSGVGALEIADDGIAVQRENEDKPGLIQNKANALKQAERALGRAAVEIVNEHGNGRTLCLIFQVQPSCARLLEQRECLLIDTCPKC